MLTILTDKGTGIVTSVPSDSPDDSMAMKTFVRSQMHVCRSVHIILSFPNGDFS
ncbi:hypothetical protein M758_12G151600 [Ceratodon purpureus]|nr:hypothetical protein M758_12G151600 [Ceratodon purpureus]